MFLCEFVVTMHKKDYCMKGILHNVLVIEEEGYLVMRKEEHHYLLLMILLTFLEKRSLHTLV